MKAWDELEEFLRGLRDDSPEWQDYEEAISIAAGLRDDRQSRIDARQRGYGDLAKALKRLTFQVDLLRRFGFPEAAAWEADACPATSLGDALKWTMTLQVLLDGRQSIVELLKTDTSIPEEHGRLDELRRNDQEILALARKLADIFEDPPAVGATSAPASPATPQVWDANHPGTTSDEPECGIPSTGQPPEEIPPMLPQVRIPGPTLPTLSGGESSDGSQRQQGPSAADMDAKDGSDASLQTNKGQGNATDHIEEAQLPPPPAAIVAATIPDTPEPPLASTAPRHLPEPAPPVVSSEAPHAEDCPTPQAAPTGDSTPNELSALSETTVLQTKEPENMGGLAAQQPSSGDAVPSGIDGEPQLHNDNGTGELTSVTAASGSYTGSAGSPGGGRAQPEPPVTERSVQGTAAAAAPARAPSARATHSWDCAPTTGLPPLLHTALQMEKDPSPDWDRLLLSLIACHDLPGAYWLAWSMERAAISPAVPSRWIAAYQGVLWLEGPSDRLVYDLVDYGGDADTVTDPVLRLAVALPGALLAPDTDLRLWLRPVKAPVEVEPFLKAVSAFADTGHVLRRLDAVPSPAAEGSLSRSQTVDAIGRWLTTKLASQYGAKKNWTVPATWKLLVNEDAPLHALMVRAAQDRTEDRVVLRKQAIDIKEDAPRMVQEAFATVVGGRGELQGTIRTGLVTQIRTAADLVLEWCTAVDAEVVGKKSGESGNIVRTFQQECSRIWPDVQRWINRTRASEVGHFRATTLYCLMRAAARVLPLVGIEVALPSFRACVTECARPQSAGESALRDLLRRRLLWIPETPLRGGDIPSESAPLALAKALDTAILEGRTLGDAARRWIEDERDFTVAEQVLSEIPAAEAKEQRTCFEAALAEARRSLAKRLTEAGSRVERAVTAGLFSMEDRAELMTEIEGINPERLTNIREAENHIDRVLARVPDVDHFLEQKRITWQALERKLRASERIEPSDADQICWQIEEDFRREDIQVLDARLPELEQALNGAPEPLNLDRLGWFQTAPLGKDLDRFIRCAGDLYLRLTHDPHFLKRVADGIEKNEQPLEQVGLRLPFQEQQRNSAKNALSKWLEIKSSPNTITGAFLGPVLAFLGFTRAPAAEKQEKSVSNGPSWRLFECPYRASPNLVRPAWCFGSGAHDVQDVLLVYGQPAPQRLAEIVSECLRQSTNRCLLVFYFGARQEADRRKFAQLSWENSLDALVLDDSLLAYLCAEDDIRLPAFIRCSLPYSAIVPYTPDNRGDVPEEMFVGRSALLRELPRESGSCLIYGGRQLGKSTLLTRIHDTWNAPPKSFVWNRNVKTICQTEDEFDPNAIWPWLADRLRKDAGLAIKVSIPQKVQTEIAQFVNNDANRPRILLLLDEVDGFLDADSAKDFANVHLLRQLMADTGRRFKVVFAGNKSVKRFDSIPNQPLEQFGHAYVVGPLEPADARRLVEEPLAALGFHFDSDATLLLVLSLTNYHAVCIHAICNVLVTNLRKRNLVKLPFTITRRDVGDAYQEVSTRISHIFLKTLELDDVYQVTTLAMIQDQYKVNGYSRPYSPWDLFDLAEKKWPKGFANMEMQDFLLRLDELCGLGVLIQNRDGTFRLRNPNLARLLASLPETFVRLEKYAEFEKSAAIELEFEHPRLEDEGWSPLNYGDLKLLNLAQSGVSLIFATGALGGDAIPDALRRLLPARALEEKTADLARIPAEYCEPGHNWLSMWLEKRKSYRDLVLVSPALANGDMIPWLKHLVEAVQTFAGEQSRRIRIYVVFDAAAHWKWMQVDPVQRASVLSGAQSEVLVRKWARYGVMKRLEMENLPVTDDFVEGALQATNGWHLLLDRCLAGRHTTAFLQKIQQFRNALVNSSQSAADFAHATGVLVSAETSGAIRWLRENEGFADSEYLGPDALSAYGLTTPERCQQTLDYLERIGCIRREDSGYRLDDTLVHLSESAFEVPST